MKDWCGLQRTPNWEKEIKNIATRKDDVNKDFQELVKIFEFTRYGDEAKLVLGMWTEKKERKVWWWEVVEVK